MENLKTQKQVKSEFKSVDDVRNKIYAALSSGHSKQHDLLHAFLLVSDEILELKEEIKKLKHV
jgi:hypothetical protein